MISFLTILILVLISSKNSLGDEFTDEEKAKLAELREVLKKDGTSYALKWLENTPDAILGNYFEFYDYDIPKTKVKLIETLEWRNKNNIDKIDDWKEPELLRKYIPHDLTGFNEEGRPIHMMKQGKWKLREAITQISRNDILRYFIKIPETMTRLMVQRLKEGEVNETIGQYLILGNLDGISLWQISSIRVLSTFAGVIGILEKHYPIHFSEGRLINTPDIFQTVLGIMTRVLNSKTIGRMKLFKEEDEGWREGLSDEVIQKLLAK